MCPGSPKITAPGALRPCFSGPPRGPPMGVSCRTVWKPSCFLPLWGSRGQARGPLVLKSEGVPSLQCRHSTSLPCWTPNSLATNLVSCRILVPCPLWGRERRVAGPCPLTNRTCTAHDALCLPPFSRQPGWILSLKLTAMTNFPFSGGILPVATFGEQLIVLQNACGRWHNFLRSQLLNTRSHVFSIFPAWPRSVGRFITETLHLSLPLPVCSSNPQADHCQKVVWEEIVGASQEICQPPLKMPWIAARYGG